MNTPRPNNNPPNQNPSGLPVLPSVRPNPLTESVSKASTGRKLSRQDGEQEDAYLERVLSDFQSRIRHTLSASIAGNTEEESLYESQLAAYKRFDGDKLSGKFDFRNENIGWKFHLNIAAKDVSAVSQYLKQKGYHHKYLSGGEASIGKIFTLYIGSYQLTEKLSEELCRDLAQYLRRPKASEDIEFSGGVVGRFNYFEGRADSLYGPFGFSLARDDWKKYVTSKYICLSNNQPLPKNFLIDSTRKAMKKLFHEHGEYFVG